MDAAMATVFQSSTSVFRHSSSAVRSPVFTANNPNFLRISTRPVVPNKHFWKPMHKKNATESRKCVAVRASAEPAAAPIAPLELESPVGKFLSQILISHPHLVPAAVEQQLEQLQTNRNADQKNQEPSASGTDLVLYRRIAGIKANERKKALEEIFYALTVQKFMNSGVIPVPAIATTSSLSDSSGCVSTCPSLLEKLEQLHSSEAYEMIHNHLALILGNKLNDVTFMAQINKLRVGQVYAASVMYGYFLKRVDQRFQLEKTVKLPPNAPSDERKLGQAVGEDARFSGLEDSYQSVSSHFESSGSGDFSYGIKPSKLRTYVMSFHGETLQRYATIRSKEALSIIEKHAEALFRQSETVNSSNDELITISFCGLKRLVLEAVTFGSFLWDVESYVDSRYNFVLN